MFRSVAARAHTLGRHARSQHLAALARPLGHANVTHRTFAMEQQPWRHIPVPHTVSVIGVPMKYGQAINGPDEAPAALRDAGLLKDLAGLGWRVEDRGDVEVPPPTPVDPKGVLAAKHSYSVGVGNQRVTEVVKEVIDDQHFSLVIGGDHSIALSTVAGQLSKRPNLGVVWVDAHGDIQQPATSSSANMHGMPVAFLMKLVEDMHELPGYEWMKEVPKLNPEQLVYIGLRDIDEPEKRLLKELGITAYSMAHIDRYGIGKVMDLTLEQLVGDGDRPLHCSFDIDGCDPSIAFSTGTRVDGGLNYREAHYTVEALASSGQLVAMDMVEVNPRIGTGEQAASTVKLANSLITSALGETIL